MTKTSIIAGSAITLSLLAASCGGGSDAYSAGSLDEACTEGLAASVEFTTAMSTAVGGGLEDGEEFNETLLAEAMQGAMVSMMESIHDIYYFAIEDGVLENPDEIEDVLPELRKTRDAIIEADVSTPESLANELEAMGAGLDGVEPLFKSDADLPPSCAELNT